MDTLIADYLSRGLSLIPVRTRSKIPAVAWEKYQTRRASEEELTAFFRDTGAQNVGIVTGWVRALWC